MVQASEYKCRNGSGERGGEAEQKWLPGLAGGAGGGGGDVPVGWDQRSVVVGRP